MTSKEKWQTFSYVISIESIFKFILLALSILLFFGSPPELYSPFTSLEKYVHLTLSSTLKRLYKIPRTFSYPLQKQYKISHINPDVLMCDTLC